MKSREEYTASIFTKRDALLEKRKKRITAAISAVCIALSFVAAAAFLPKTINKTKVDITAETTVQSIATQTSSAIQYEEQVDYLLREETYQLPKAEACQPQKTEAEAGTVSDETEKVFGDSQNSFDENVDSKLEEFNPNLKPEEAEQSFSDDEIIKKAYSYLSAEEKEMCKNTEPFITVTNQSGSIYYTVYYFTGSGNVTVELSSNNLELIKKESKLTSGNSTTAKPPMPPMPPMPPVMTSAAYNPNS